NLPFDDEVFDATISECVICLVPDKQRALEEKMRVLKPGGRVIMHDVIRWCEMPAAMRNNPTLYCGCISGAVTIDDYRD
ncbi:MAG: methyltransferase domain-containing protein, partial [Nitrososphaeria archaeon]|nr:methyltransferase domain-containing protein [Nitrososphaeria archaeon]